MEKEDYNSNKVICDVAANNTDDGFFQRTQYSLKIKEFDGKDVLWNGEHPLVNEIIYDLDETELSLDLGNILRKCVALNYVLNSDDMNLKTSKDATKFALTDPLKSLFIGNNTETVLYIQNLKACHDFKVKRWKSLQREFTNIKSMIETSSEFMRRSYAHDVLNDAIALEQLLGTKDKLEEYEAAKEKLDAWKNAILKLLQKKDTGKTTWRNNFNSLPTFRIVLTVVSIIVLCFVVIYV